MTDQKEEGAGGDAAMMIMKEEEKDTNSDNTEKMDTEKEKGGEVPKTLAPEEARKREQQKRLELLLDKTAKYTHFLSSSLGKDTYGAGGSESDMCEPDKKRAKGSNETTTNVKIKISQPPTVTGGVLRHYQLEALNWLIQLFENGNQKNTN